MERRPSRARGRSGRTSVKRVRVAEPRRALPSTRSSRSARERVELACGRPGPGAACTASVRRSRTRAPHARSRPSRTSLELAEDPIRCVGLHRRRRGRRSRSRSWASPKKRCGAPPRARPRRRGRQQAARARAHHLGHAAGRGREHGRADGQRLDDRVRKVLPARGEDGRVGRAKELEHPLARLRAEKADARRRSRARRRAARGGGLPVGALSGGDEQLDPLGALATASTAIASDFCAVSLPAKATVAGR